MSPISQKELLARFLRHSNHFKSSTNRVLPSAFLPSPLQSGLSTFRIHDLTEVEASALGRSHVPEHKGWAEISVEVVEDTGSERAKLRVVPDDFPPRHANIEGFPLDKEGRLLYAAELARKSRLRLIPGIK